MVTTLTSLFSDELFEPANILDFLSITTKLNLAITCSDFTKLLNDTKFWSILDFRGTKNTSSSLAVALNKPKISKSLTHLNLEFCKEIQDKDLDHINGLIYVNLNALHKVTNQGIMNIAKRNAETLKRFELYWHHALENETLIQIAKHCHQLILINLSGCQKIEDSGLRTLARNCLKLTNIDLTRCPLLSDAGLEFLCSKLNTGITSLNLYADSQFSDQGLKFIARLSNIRFLDICGVGKISSKIVQEIARGCRLLESLNLTWCINVDDEAMFVVAECCTLLQLLSVFGLRGVSDAMLDALALPGRCSATLTTLDVHGCPNVKRQADALLLEQFPKLTCFTHHS